jgi:hypothetical protein
MQGLLPPRYPADGLGRRQAGSAASILDLLLRSIPGLTVQLGMEATGLSADAVRLYVQRIDELICPLKGQPDGPWKYAVEGFRLDSDRPSNCGAQV